MEPPGRHAQGPGHHANETALPQTNYHDILTYDQQKYLTKKDKIILLTTSSKAYFGIFKAYQKLTWRVVNCDTRNVK